MQDELPRNSEKFDGIPKGALTRWCQESSPGIPSRALGDRWGVPRSGITWVGRLSSVASLCYYVKGQ